ncbi:MAG TPA: alpha/beta hydrolase [Solimonas sp.]|nr:alpha/beta hydrolase [Solimonas sp.]
MQPVVHRTAQGLSLVGSAFGPEAGRPVLLFHGGGQTRHAWGGTGEALGRAGFRAIAWDQRGHGDSDWAQAYTPQAFADDVLEIARAQPRRPYIVGASMGGIAGMVANASSAGEISDALVLVDVAPRLNGPGVERILDFMAAHPQGFADLDEAAAAVGAYQPQRAQKGDRSGLQKNLRQRADGRWYWHWDPAMLATFDRAHQMSQSAEGLYHAAEKLTQPVLLVRGTLSDVIDESITREFQQRIPQARVADVSGAGHMVAGDRNDVFLDAVLEFLRALP